MSRRSLRSSGFLLAVIVATTLAAVRVAGQAAAPDSRPETACEGLDASPHGVGRS